MRDNAALEAVSSERDEGFHTFLDERAVSLGTAGQNSKTFLLNAD